MKKNLKLNQILHKLIAAIMLGIILFTYPIESLAVGEFIKDLVKNESEQEDEEGSGGTSTPAPSSGAWANPFEAPQPMSSDFGHRIHPVRGTPDFHNGYDMAAPTGMEILAVSDGVVIASGYHSGYGYRVEVQRTDGYTWIAAHMVKEPEVRTGDNVKLGQIIGYVGNTGVSSGPHLHLEIRENGTTPVDPKLFIDFKTPGVSKGMGFSNPSNSLALDDLKRMINQGDFYYKGVPEGHFMRHRFNLFEWIVNFLGEIFDYMIGMATLVFRLGFIGWGSIIEALLTDSLDSLVVKSASPDKYRKINKEFYTDSKRTVNVENIFFNRVEVLNVNFFESKDSVKKRLLKYSPSGLEVAELYGIDVEDITEEDLAKAEQDAMDALEEGPVLIIKDYFAILFRILYGLALGILLGALILNAILASLESAGARKATYKERAKDWLRALFETVLVLIYMVGILQLHTWLIDFLADVADSSMTNLAGNYIQTDMGQNYTIMETIRTRAYAFKFSVGFPASIMYIVLIWYTIKFFLMYVKRFLVLFFLSVLGPILMVYDLIMKTIKGKSEIRMDWIKEYTFNVLIQAVHAFVYVIFIPISYNLASQSIIGFIIMFMLLKFLLEADGIIRQIFNIRGARRHSTLDNVTKKSTLKDYMGGVAVASFVGSKSLPTRKLKEVSKKVIKPAKFVAGRTGDLVLRGAYNTRQIIKETLRDDKGAGDQAELAKKQEKKDIKVKDVLRLQGYSEQEIKDRIGPDATIPFSEEQKDRIRLLEVSQTRKTNLVVKGVNRVKYTGNRLRRVVRDMSEVDDKGRRRIRSGMFEYDTDKEKIVFKDSLHDKFRESVIKEFEMGKGEKGRAEYDKTVKDLKMATSIGAKTFVGAALFPVSLIDSSVSSGLSLGLRGNFQFKSKTIGRPDRKKGRPALVEVERRGTPIRTVKQTDVKKPIDGEKTSPQLKGSTNSELAYKGRTGRALHNRGYKKDNKKIYEANKKADRKNRKAENKNNKLPDKT